MLCVSPVRLIRTENNDAKVDLVTRRFTKSPLINIFGNDNGNNNKNEGICVKEYQETEQYLKIPEYAQFDHCTCRGQQVRKKPEPEYVQMIQHSR